MQKDDVFRFLIDAGRAAPSADNMQPWRLQRQGDDLVLRYDAARFDHALFPFDHQATLLTMGAVIENIDQACKSLQLDVTLAPVVPTAAPHEFLRLRLPEAPAVVPAGAAPWRERHTNRLPFSREPLHVETKNALQQQAQGSNALLLIDARPAIAAIAGLVRLASQARFQTREIHEWFARSLRFDAAEVASGTGLDVDTFDLPPGGKAFLRAITKQWRNMAFFNRLGGYRFMSAIEALSITKAGALLAIVGPETADATLAAGRLMERVWIELNAAGYGVQPYYVVSDQLLRLKQGTVPPRLQPMVARLETALNASLRMPPGHCLHMLLRVGKPLRAPKRALRLPQESSPS